MFSGQFKFSFGSPSRRSHFRGSGYELCCLGVGDERIITSSVRQWGHWGREGVGGWQLVFSVGSRLLVGL